MRTTMAMVVLAFSAMSMAWASGCAPIDGEAAPEEETDQSTAAVLTYDGGACPYAFCAIPRNPSPGCMAGGRCIPCIYVGCR